MNYTDSIDEQIKAIEKNIKDLHKVKQRFKKEKQKYCRHLNVIRKAHMPRIPSLYATSSPYVADSEIRVRYTAKCADCGKIFK